MFFLPEKQFYEYLKVFLIIDEDKNSNSILAAQNPNNYASFGYFDNQMAPNLKQDGNKKQRNIDENAYNDQNKNNPFVLSHPPGHFIFGGQMAVSLKIHSFNSWIHCSVNPSRYFLLSKQNLIQQPPSHMSLATMQQPQYHFQPIPPIPYTQQIYNQPFQYPYIMNSPNLAQRKNSYSGQAYYPEGFPRPYPFPYSSYSTQNVNTQLPFRTVPISNTKSQQSFNSIDIKLLNSPISVANGATDDDYDDVGHTLKQSKFVEKFPNKKAAQPTNDDASQQDLWVKLQTANSLSNKVKAIQKPPLNSKLNQKAPSKQASRQGQHNNELNYIAKNKETIGNRFQMKSYEKLHTKHKELNEK